MSLPLATGAVNILGTDLTGTGSISFNGAAATLTDYRLILSSQVGPR